MKSRIKTILRQLTRLALGLAAHNRLGRFISETMINSVAEQVVKVKHQEMSFRFAAPNAQCRWRYETLSTKEPETLEWIDNIPEGSVLWDVGANIGIYSIYAAKARHCSVYAFEPSVFNLEVLARNIFLNQLKNVCIVPIALSNQTGPNQLKMTSVEWGGALSTFGETYGWDGKNIQCIFEFTSLGITIDSVKRALAIPDPDYIKLDVDGIEHLILSGGPNILAGIKGILIEVNDAFNEQAQQCQNLLSQAGLKLLEKRQSEMVSNSTSGFQNAFNQIWSRN